MSIKTSQTERNWILFLIISMGLHAALIGLALSPKTLKEITPELLKRSPIQLQKPFYIDVITLPPDAIGRKETPKKLLRLADRSMTVDEESSPLPLRGIGPGTSGGVAQTPQQAGQNKSKTQRPVDGKQERQWDLGMKGTSAKGEQIAKSKAADSNATKAKKMKKQSSAGDAVTIIDWKEMKTTEAAGTKKGNKSLSNKKTSAIAGSKGAPSLFPSQNTIAKVVQKNSGGRRAGIYTKNRGKRLQINASELKDARYLLDLKRKLDLYWNYPISAARRGEQGKLRAIFKVKRDGTIFEIKLVKSSGYPTLDDAVITALRLCSPLNPLPDSFEKKELNVRANFEYILTRM